MTFVQAYWVALLGFSLFVVGSSNRSETNGRIMLALLWWSMTGVVLLFKEVSGGLQ